MRESKLNIYLHYFLIYVMLLVPGSCFFAVYLSGDIKHYFILGLFTVLAISNKKYRKYYGIALSGVLFIAVIYIRMKNGGAGIGAWLQFTSCIISTQMAICCNKEKFLKRFLNVVVFLSVVSIVFWALFCISPNLVNTLPGDKYLVQILGTRQWAALYHGKGLFLYSFLEIHPTRNCGIFTEPGVHQIVLNSALFVLLFLKDKLYFKSFKEYRKYLFIILITLVTCQSTTGYVGMLLNIMFFYFLRNKKDKSKSKIKFYITIIIMVAIIVLLFDYSNNGKDSILYIQVIEKLFGGNLGGGINITESTGISRLSTIIVGFKAVARDPFGVGYDVFQVMKDAYDTGEGLTAASVIVFMAVYGVITWAVTILSVIKPVFSRMKVCHALLFLLLFFNTTLAQTELLYPALIMMPMYLVFTNTRKRKYTEIREFMWRGSLDE